MSEDWISLAKEFGYEGAAAIVCNKNDEILFLLSEKDGKMQAEMAGGKVEKVDNGNPRLTALRELREETGIDLNLDDLTQIEMKTTGGTTGMPSIQFLTKPLDSDSDSDNIKATKLESKFIGTVWSKVYHPSEKEWFIKDKIPIRRFNTFFLDQNKSALSVYCLETIQ